MVVLSSRLFHFLGFLGTQFFFCDLLKIASQVQTSESEISLHGGPSAGPVWRHVVADVGVAAVGSVRIQPQAVPGERRAVTAVDDLVERAARSVISERRDRVLHHSGAAREAGGADPST